MRQDLFLMLGYPGSGKSYFARQLAEQISAVRLNGDGVRHAMFEGEEAMNPKNNPMVFGALDYAANQVLKAGYSVIYDASHNKYEDREKGRVLAGQYGVEPIIVWVQITKQTAKDRVASRERLPDQPFIRPERLDQLMKNLQPPKETEPCIKIDGTVPFDEQYQSFQQQLGSF